MQLTPAQKDNFCTQVINVLKTHCLYESAKKYEFVVKNGILGSSFSLVDLTIYAKEMLCITKLSGKHNTEYMANTAFARIEEIAAVFAEQDKDRRHQEQILLQQQILAELRKIGTRLDAVESKLNSVQNGNEPAKVSSPQLFKNK